MEEERRFIEEILKTDKVSQVMQAFFPLPFKKDYASIEERKKGNDLYIKKNHTASDHDSIWKFYTKSIALAPCSNKDDLEVLASGYGNRSALLFHIGKFQESIIDIDRALKITKMDNLKTKLLNRKAKCQAAIEENEKKFSNCTPLEVDADSMISDNCQKSNNRSKAQVQEILSATAAEDPFKSIHLKYNKKYGRHLVAKREFKPGEIIMSVKPYVNAINFKNQYAFCGHCMKTTWTSIPCDYCNWCLFCSEKCKQEAWQKYHDIECRVIPYFMFDESGDYWKQLSLRLIVIAIREAGSIDNLRKDLKKIDDCSKEYNKGFVNGKFYGDKFQSIYSLCKDVAPDVLESLADQSVLTLIYIAKGSSLFGVNFTTNKDLLNNKDVIFIGSLFLRFMRISDINSHCVTEGNNSCRLSREPEVCATEKCCEKGVCIAAIPSLINHSCFPNIGKCFTENMQLVIYALQPIRKNYQLFDSYIGYFFDKPKSVRQLKLQNFNFVCNCTACKEDWPPLLINKEQRFISFKKENQEAEEMFIDRYNHFLTVIDNDYEKSNLSSIEYLSNNILKAAKQLVQPCHATPLLMSALYIVFDNLFGFKLKISNECIS